jgi:hypothetical protein
MVVSTLTPDSSEEDLKNLKIVNITPESSAKGLKEDLEKEADRRGKQLRAFIGDIYAYAVNNKDKYSGELSSPRQKHGPHIGAVVSSSAGDSLKQWAKDIKTSRGRLCCFILEKTIEGKLLKKIFPGEGSSE